MQGAFSNKNPGVLGRPARACTGHRRAASAVLAVIAMAACADEPLAPISGEGTDPVASFDRGGGTVTLPPPGRIVFASAVTGDFEIYSMNPDGTDVRRLTTSPGLDLGPAVSPNGRRIAFISLRTGSLEIHSMNADGSSVRQLTSLGGAVRNLAWSPDGRKIAFSMATPGSDSKIFVMNASGSAIRQLTTDAGDDRYPSWSPDGQQIAFSSSRSGTDNVYIINTDGTNVTPFTDCRQGCFAPAWSPDGTRIAYHDNDDGDGVQIVTVQGVTQPMVIHLETHDLFEGPSWSPDGVKLTYAARVNACETCPFQKEIFTISADGSSEQRLTFTFVDELTPFWGR